MRGAATGRALSLGKRTSVPVEWLTIQEAAELLRVKVSWLYERTRTNSIPHVKLGKYLRFDRDKLTAWGGEFKRNGGPAERAARPSRGLSRIRR